MKMGVENYIFWSEIGEPGGTPPPGIPRSTSPPESHEVRCARFLDMLLTLPNIE